MLFPDVNPHLDFGFFLEFDLDKYFGLNYEYYEIDFYMMMKLQKQVTEELKDGIIHLGSSWILWRVIMIASKLRDLINSHQHGKNLLI